MIKSENNKKEGFMQGVLALMIAQILIKLLGLVYKLYITNRQGFGDEGNAIYNAGFSIYALLLALSSTGVPNAIAKMVSEKISIGDSKGAHRIFKIAIGTFAVIGLAGTSLMFFGAKYIACNWLSMPEAEYTLIALSPSVFFVSVNCVLRGYFNGRGVLKATARSQTIEQIFKTILTIVVVEIVAFFTGTNTTFMAAGANLATTFATMVSITYMWNFYFIRKKDIKNEMKNSTYIETNRKSIIRVIKDILFVSVPMSLSSILASFNTNIDAMTVKSGLMKIMDELSAQRQYGILSGKVNTLTTLPLSFNIAFATALVPAISGAKAKGDFTTAKQRISFSLLITMLIGLPCVVGLMVLADPILHLLFPNQPDGALLLQISAISIVFMALEQTVNGALQGIGKIFIPATSLLIGVFAKLILNILFVPIIGATAAAWATVVCHVIAFLIGYCVLINNINIGLKINKFLVKPIIASGVMGLFGYFSYMFLGGLVGLKLATIIAILISIIVYIIMVILLKILDKDEILMIPYAKKITDIFSKNKMSRA